MSRSDPIRVLLVDDNEMLRDSLTLFLELYDDLELVGEAGNGMEAIQMCDHLHPDIVLMDLVMPEMDGATATRLIRKNYPETQVIALTSFDNGDLVRTALRAGAISYLLKNVSMTDLAKAIRDAHHGKSTMSPEAAQTLDTPPEDES